MGVNQVKARPEDRDGLPQGSDLPGGVQFTGDVVRAGRHARDGPVVDAVAHAAAGRSGDGGRGGGHQVLVGGVPLRAGAVIQTDHHAGYHVRPRPGDRDTLADVVAAADGLGHGDRGRMPPRRN